LTVAGVAVRVQALDRRREIRFAGAST